MPKKASNLIPDGAVKPSPPSSPPPKSYNIDSYMSDTIIVQVFENGNYLGNCRIDRDMYGPFIDLSCVVDPRKDC